MLGSADDQTLGNSDALRKAQNALKQMAIAIPMEGRTEAEVHSGLCKTLLIYLKVRMLSLHCVCYLMVASRYVQQGCHDVHRA